ncbi:unnamed protein product [Adineta ricciae]|uniref:Uncharacterized protein n=1 Tax=Adineta ricciae TaxID=249248 RepID=A0A815D719_ADIRI|nr:unnamed protein product [Adineta ricciae]
MALHQKVQEFEETILLSAADPADISPGRSFRRLDPFKSESISVQLFSTPAQFSPIPATRSLQETVGKWLEPTFELPAGTDRAIITWESTKKKEEAARRN